ncbi:MAG: CbiX/SirB N-terminal domain-containing protein [Bacteroidales bacterium]|nr:CbiX/SirB N-terminal domain-containing protein [Bacteroidales bacterium]
MVIKKSFLEIGEKTLVMSSTAAKTASLFLVTILFIFAFTSCKWEKESKGHETIDTKHKIGVLLVNHGSHSETWRKALIDLETSVSDSILSGKIIEGIKTAHMEYTEPSIATRLKEFDSEGFTDIVIVPVFLTVSPHSFEDIPTIVGQKEDPQSMEMLKVEKIERYTPKAKTHIAPLLDFTDILQKNVLRRSRELSKNPEKEGLVLIGYGDETYDKEWGELFDNVAEYVKQNTGIGEHSCGWCGHIAHYNPEETTKAINTILNKKEVAIVIPVLVAHDETFQIKIIGGGIEKVENNQVKVRYKPDAILPDTNIENWVIRISNEYSSKIKENSLAGK